MSIGSFLFGDAPSYDYSGYEKALALLQDQQKSVSDYYKSAEENLNTQYNAYYGQEMQDAVNTLAARGIYNSPVSQVSLNRKTAQLANVYANAQSNLAAQKLSAQTGIQSSLANYYTSLAGTQYSEAQNKYSANAAAWESLVGASTGLLVGV